MNLKDFQDSALKAKSELNKYHKNNTWRTWKINIKIGVGTTEL